MFGFVVALALVAAGAVGVKAINDGDSHGTRPEPVVAAPAPGVEWSPVYFYPVSDSADLGDVSPIGASE